MKFLLPIILAFALVGCDTIPQKEKIVTVVEYKYVIVKVPQSGIEIPPAPEVPDYEKATDKEIAEFIIEQEGFVQKLINIIKGVPAYATSAIENLMKQGVKKENIIE